VFVARTLELWADEADQVDWWKKRRGVAYTTNAIENLHSRLRQTVPAHGYFQTEQAALKCLFLATPQPRPNRSRPAKMEQPLEGSPQRVRHHLRTTTRAELKNHSASEPALVAADHTTQAELSGRVKKRRRPLARRETHDFHV
jgi:hypothetical protein